MSEDSRTSTARSVPSPRRCTRPCRWRPFRPLDAEAIKAAARPARSGRTRWLKGMAAAAAVVVAVGIGAALLPRMVASAPTAAPAASGGYAAGGAVPETANDRAAAAAQPKASSRCRRLRWRRPLPLIAAHDAPERGDGEFYLVGGAVDAPHARRATCMAVDSTAWSTERAYDRRPTLAILPEAPIALTWQPPAVVGGAAVLRRTGTGSMAPWSSPPSTASATAWTHRRTRAGDAGGSGDRLVSVAGDSAGTDQVFDPHRPGWVDLPRDVLGTDTCATERGPTGSC